jgi:hypothetical protein
VKFKLTVGVLLALSLVIGGCTLFNRMELADDPINASNLAKINPGMKLKDVEALLGSKGEKSGAITNLVGAWYDWYGTEGQRIQVGIDRHTGEVFEAHFYDPEPGSFLDNVIRLLGW